jgi:hypothetical protein
MDIHHAWGGHIMKNFLTIATVGLLAWPVVTAAGEPEKSRHDGGPKAIHHEAPFRTHEPTSHGPATPPSYQRRENFHGDPVVRAALRSDPYGNALPKSVLKADHSGEPKPTITQQKAAIKAYEIAHGIPLGNRDRHNDERGGSTSIKVLLEHDPSLRKALTGDPYVNALDPAVLKRLHVLPEYLATLGLGPVVSSLVKDYAAEGLPKPTIAEQKAAIEAFDAKLDRHNPPHKTWTPSRIEARSDEVDDHHYAQSVNHNIPTQPTYCRFC